MPVLSVAPGLAGGLEALAVRELVAVMQHTATGMHTARVGAAAPRSAPQGPAAGPPVRGGATARDRRAAAANPPPAAWHQPQHHHRAAAAATAAAAAAAVAGTVNCRVSAAAFAAALDASSGLPVTWLSHWQQVEAQRAARRALVASTRGRQQQRMHQVATLMQGGSTAAGNPAGSSSGSSSSPSSSSGSQAGSEAQLLGSSRTSGSSGQSGPEAQLLGSGSSGGSLQGSLQGSLDAPPLQQASELDELTWLASHPPEGEAAAAGAGVRNWAEHHRQQQGQGQGRQQGREQQHGQGQQVQPQQHLQQQQQQPHLAGVAPEASPAVQQGPLQLWVGEELVTARPLWIAVYQPEPGGPAKLFESVAPLLPEVVGRLSADISPFCSVESGMRFAAADEAAGGWLNYFVGLVGVVAPHEDDILWPNKVLHRDRVLFNMRNGWDVARFLAEPIREDVEEHRTNLLRLAAERKYRRGWAWHMLCMRWGESTLRTMGLEV